ncbi:DUF2202 domain-containing protein, partial [Mesotoga prima]
SESHLRAFLKQYERLAGSYSPEVLSVDRFNEIVSAK